jgi:6-phosphogluconolactonase
MELVIAPVAELRAEITHAFEDLVAASLEQGAGGEAVPHTCTCGVTGGSAALIFFGALRDAAVDWSRITLFWGDERAVPPDHPDSNYGLADQLLLMPLGARAPYAVRMQGELADLTTAAKAYAKQLPEALDLLLLGVGDDGHVCSLFPGHPALQVTDHVVAIEDAPKPPPRRLSLSLSYIIRARHVWIVAVGARKRLLLENALSRDHMLTPLDLVVAQAPHVTLFTDQALRRAKN